MTTRRTSRFLHCCFLAAVATSLCLGAWMAEAQEPTPAKEPAAAESKSTPNVALPSKEDLARWAKPIDQIRVWAPAPQGPLPTDGSTSLFAQKGTAAARLWACGNVAWCPSELAYHPLYFDDVPLERYGQTPCPILQPALSGALFFGTVPLLPYKMLIDRPCDCIWAYGYYRPGSPTPCIRQRFAN